MNQFAHSVDDHIKATALDELIAVVIKLSLRFAANRGVHLEHQASATPLSITTSPFLLQNLVWLCLDKAMDLAGEKKNVSIITKDVENGVIIEFKHSGTLREKSGSSFPGEKENTLIRLLEATMEINDQTGEIVLRLPVSIDK
jgi:hypothetical protein